MLRSYDTIIIDEAHERSLNIDFLLGYLKQLLPRRPDLKVIITSATIDPQRFARHFAEPNSQPSGARPSGAASPAARADQQPGGAERSASSGGGAGARCRTAGAAARRSSRCPAAPTRSRCATGRWSRSPTTRGRRERPGPDPGDRRRGRRAGRRGARRHPGLPARRAGDPGHRRRAASCAEGTGAARHRGPAAVRPAVRRRAAPGLPAAHRAPGRAGHQRRRDVADRARHPVRRRPRHRPDLPLQPSAQGAAAADRADLPGLGRTSAPAAAAGPRTASASGCTPRRTSRPGRSSPSPRSCGPTWPR